MAEKRTKPAIRFAGYTDAWEQRKCKDIAPLQRGFDLPTSQMIPGKYPVVMSNGVGGYHSVYKVKGPGVVTGRSGTIGKLHYIDDDYWPHNTALWVTDFKRNCPKFIFYLYQQLELSRFGTGSGVPTLNRNDVHDASMSIPKCDEQEKITSLFNHLDHLITLHQRKYDKLVCIKKAMLEKMFPKNGATVPEIRFSGFTDAWEQRKLSEVYTERNERGNDALPILSVSIHHGISNGELDSDSLGKQVRRSEDKSLYKHVESGDLVLNMMRAWQGAVGVARTEGMVSPAYITAAPCDQLFPSFMDHCLRRRVIINQMDNLSYGVTDFRKRLYWDSFIRVECSLPSPREQEQIASLFDALDHLITLHQRELEKLKNLKKAMLEKMFV
ncbi:MAG: restriction endonuclease subunit S [Eubacteriales bacterium]|nr:restriction endonuclease subunit S [Eubacteriales bacterium]